MTHQQSGSHTSEQSSRIRSGESVRDTDRTQRYQSPDTRLDTEATFLPSLDAGVQLLKTDADHRRKQITPLQSLVVDHLLKQDGTAAWVDTNGYVTTQALSHIVPSDRLLARIQVARGFTAFQHFAIIETLHAANTDDLDLIVAPAIDGHYRRADIPSEEAQSLFLRALSRLAAIGREQAIPILLSYTATDAFTKPIDRLADRTITCSYTQFGPRFESEDFETAVYPVGNGVFQTTLTYWQQIIASRVNAHTPEQSPSTPAQSGVTINGAD